MAGLIGLRGQLGQRASQARITRAVRQDGRVDVCDFVGSGHRSIVRHALLDGLLSIVPSGEKCTGVMGAENGCRLCSTRITVPSAGRVSQSTPLLARFEPKDGDLTASRVCLQAIAAPTTDWPDNTLNAYL